MREILITFIIAAAVSGGLTYYIQARRQSERVAVEQLKTRISLRSLRRKVKINSKQITVLKVAHDKDYREFLDSLFNESDGTGEGTPPTVH